MTSVTNLFAEEPVLLPVTRIALQDLLAVYQPKMNLSHWTVEFHSTKLLPEHIYFQIEVNRDRNHAFIHYNEGRMLDPDKATLAFIHELVHLQLDNIREEHDFQLSYGAVTDKEEYRRRFTRQLEKSVETIAKTIYYSF